MVRTSETMGLRIAGRELPGKTDYRLQPSSAPVSGSECGSDFVRASRHRLDRVCLFGRESVTLCAAIDAVKPQAGGLNVEMFIAVPASANLSTFRHIVVICLVNSRLAAISRWEITDGLQRLLKGELVRRLARHQKRQRIHARIVGHVDQTFIDDFALASAATFEPQVRRWLADGIDVGRRPGTPAELVSGVPPP